MIIGTLTLLIIIIFTLITVVLAIMAPILIHLPQFGKAPSGSRLERIRRSPHYRDGQFRNLQPTEIMNVKGLQFFKVMLKFVFGKKRNLTPPTPLPMVKADLNHLDPSRDYYIWFGHSSYLISLHGTTFLVDPTFCAGAPFKFANKAFAGTERYQPEDMPSHIDYLIITHDHYDHLDYQTYCRLRTRIGHVICPLGVGAHLERWGAAPTQIIEMDWDERQPLSDGFSIFCLPSQHFSGRALKRNNTLWASFLLNTPHGNIFIGCDGGYGPHFKEIGKNHPDIDLAILENGQYNEQWKSIHTLPEQLGKEATDLHARQIITVHHSKYALAQHPWDEPLHNERRARDEYHLNLIVPALGSITELQLRQN